MSGIIHSLRKSSGMITSGFRLCLINFLDEISRGNLWIIGNVLCKASDKYGRLSSFLPVVDGGKIFLSAIHINIENCQLFHLLSVWYVKNLILCFNSHVGLTIFCYSTYFLCVKCLFLVLAFFSVSGYGIFLLD